MNGVVDILVDDDAAAVDAAKAYLSYFQGRLPPPDDGGYVCADQRLLRRAVPLSRKRVYEMRFVISTLCDQGSFLELRPESGAFEANPPFVPLVIDAMCQPLAASNATRPPGKQKQTEALALRVLPGFRIRIKGGKRSVFC